MGKLKYYFTLVPVFLTSVLLEFIGQRTLNTIGLGIISIVTLGIAFLTNVLHKISSEEYHRSVNGR